MINIRLIARRWFLLGVLVVLLAAPIALTALPAQAQGTAACPILITMYDTLYLRATPSWGGTITTQLVTNQQVCMVGRSGNNAWVQLSPYNQPTVSLGWGPASAFQTTVPITVLPVTDGTPPVVVTPTPVPPVTPPPTAQTYVVRAGDTLSSIARAYGVTLTALIQANNEVPPYTICVGQVLVIPGAAGPTLPPGYQQYTVKQGEYLVSIARLFNTDWRTLATVNGVVSPYVIYPGQVLLVPTV